MYKVYGLQDGEWRLYNIAKTAKQAMIFIIELASCKNKSKVIKI